MINTEDPGQKGHDQSNLDINSETGKPWAQEQMEKDSSGHNDLYKYIPAEKTSEEKPEDEDSESDN